MNEATIRESRSAGPNAETTTMGGRKTVTPRAGIQEAYSRVRHTGCVHGSHKEIMAQLKSISQYLDSKDPIELGAALLLEQAGYERSQVQLILELD